MSDIKNNALQPRDRTPLSSAMLTAHQHSLQERTG